VASWINQKSKGTRNPDQPRETRIKNLFTHGRSHKTPICPTMRRRKLNHPKGKGTRNPDQPRKERMKIQSNQGREVYFPIQDLPKEERAKPNQPRDKEDF